MSKFLEILKEALSDPKYGSYKEPEITFPTPEICERILFIQNISTKGQASVYQMPSPPRKVYD